MNDRSFDLYTVNGGFSSKEHKTSKLSLCNEESFNCVNQIGAQSSMSAFNTKSKIQQSKKNITSTLCDP